MLSRHKLIASLAVTIWTIPVNASSVYAVNAFQQFGSIDLTTGAFVQIGPNTPEGQSGLVPGPGGSLLTLTFSGNLDSIDPGTGATAVVGPTGLGDCSTPASLCGPNSANTLGFYNGTIYATDFQNDLYRVNPLTGAATLIGSTGIPAVPFFPGATNPDGTVNILDQTLFSAAGKLYSTFDAFKFNFGTLTETTVIAPKLYQIDTSTGLATVIGPTEANLGAAVEVNGTSYAFDDVTLKEVALDVANGDTAFVSNFDMAAGVVTGVSPTPEPDSIVLGGIGIAATLIGRWRRRRVGESGRTGPAA